MKKISIKILVCASIFCASTLIPAYAKNIKYAQLPANVQSAVKNYCNPDSIVTVEDHPYTYLIKFGKGNFIELYKDKPGWKKVYMPKGIPPKLFNTLPKPILKYVKENYPKNKFISMEFFDDGTTYQLRMMNKVELMFDSQGQFITLED